MGYETAPLPEQCGTTAKTSEWERAAPKTRGGGGPPPATLCVRAFSRESLDPPPGTGREPTLQVWTCAGPNPDHLPGAARCCVPSGGCLRSRLGAQRPVARPAPGGGARLSLEESRRKEHQGQAPGPRVFIAARSHSLGLGMVASGPFEVLFPPVY